MLGDRPQGHQQSYAHQDGVATRYPGELGRTHSKGEITHKNDRSSNPVIVQHDIDYKDSLVLRSDQVVVFYIEEQFRALRLVSPSM